MDKVHKEQDALLEIGAEEIPSSYLPPALEFMKSRAESSLRESRLVYKSIQTLGTPRRLTLLILGLASKSEISVTEVIGPKLSAAKDSEGNWTPAAQGFARSQGTALSSLEIRETPKGQVLCAVKKSEGEKAEKILTKIFSEIPAAIPFPKKMMWEASQFRFARPLRNLVALFGSKPLRFSAAGVKSSNKTFPLSHLSSKAIPIASPQAYMGTLKNNCILVDPLARKDLILSSAQALAKKVKGTLKADGALLEEVTWLSEHPVGILGSFDKEFLNLPAEILITCMKKHQKFFSIENESGNLLPHFVGIRNGISEHQETVRSGYEKVLLARLCDAKFFFEEDLKKPLDLFAAKAAIISIQEKLGSVGERILRMKELARKISEHLPQPPDMSAVERAANLAKFDLGTRVVYEYPELQGIMGEIYALRFGENASTARAIREHYEPINNLNPVPESAEGKVLALSEKLDQLCGNFWLGYTPSGNSDPYGLRRISNGILRIVLESSWDISLAGLVAHSLKLIAARGSGAQDVSKLSIDISKFMIERFQLFLGDLGCTLDEIYSVTRNEGDPDLAELRLLSLRQKVNALHAMRGHSDFGAVVGAYKRAGNILKQARQKGIEFSSEQFDASLLTDPAEKNLHGTVDALTLKTQPLLAQKQYPQALETWVGVRGDLDIFFEKVRVMDPDEPLRRNRLSLLSILEVRFRQIADFSILQIGGE